MALTLIQECRVAVADLDTTFPILDDATYEYFLTKNESSVRRASLDAARTILLQLSLRGEETVDIFSVKGSKAAEQYRLSLQMFLKDPSLNPVLTSVSAYCGGISKQDMQDNVDVFDTNAVITANDDGVYTYPSSTDPFSI